MCSSEIRNLRRREYLSSGEHCPFCVKAVGGRRLRVLLLLLLSWSVASSLWIYPHSLSYFNESIGGPENGHQHLLGSNLDWGQDLRYLKWWMEGHPDARPLGLASFGAYDPSDIGLQFQTPALKLELGRFEPGFRPERGWHALSINLLHGYCWTAYDGKGMKVHFGGEKLSSFREMAPLARIGYSIVVYRVE